MKEWNFGEKREILGDQRMIQKYFHKNIFTKNIFIKNIFTKNIFTKIFCQNAKNISEKNCQNDQKIFLKKYFRPKYFYKNIFAKNISGKKIQKYFPICKTFLEKIFPKKLFQQSNGALLNKRHWLLKGRPRLGRSPLAARRAQAEIERQRDLSLVQI